MPLTDSFAGDLLAFAEKLATKTPFAITRMGEGEEQNIHGRGARDLRRKGAGGYRYDPNDPQYVEPIRRLAASFHYQHPRHYVGIGCPCCIGADRFRQIRDESGQPADHLTWANIWVNGNYAAFKDRVLPLFLRYQVHLVAHEGAQLDGLPFALNSFTPCRTDAWLYCDELLEQLWSRASDPAHALFAVCAGPAANIVIAELHQQYPHHTYLDLGSPLDPWLFGGKAGRTREYLVGGRSSRKFCVWG